MKDTQEQADDQAECVSIVTISSIIGPPVVGKAGQVQVGKKIYKGTIIKIYRISEGSDSGGE